MNITDSDIKLLGNYLIVNSIGLNDPGFSEGKAGISIVLFELASILDNELFESCAFELLEESLLSNITEIDFFNGLTGIGYSLLYLLNKGYIDADFDELFREKHLLIIEKFLDPEFHFQLIELLYLWEYKKFKGALPSQEEYIINHKLSSIDVKVCSDNEFINTLFGYYSLEGGLNKSLYIRFMKEFYSNLKTNNIEQSILFSYRDNLYFNNIRKVKMVIIDWIRMKHLPNKCSYLDDLVFIL